MSQNETEPNEKVLLVPDSVGVADRAETDEPETETVSAPSKVLRIGTMIKTLLDEVRQTALDEPSRARMKEIYETSVAELKSGLSADLAAELDRLSLTFLKSDLPSDSELRLAQAQLVGWLEGLFHGIQATLFAQQMQARNQLDEMRRRGLPAPPDESHLPGTYL
ncbi:MAG: DUF2587 domain-containing protein [Nitrospiraceae bacterium]|nr:DUF2587 domain-containing protein [Nitrospiraceae bacterium]MDA8208105.1 DUF2587 domain-containing protein [Actinomycetota bacterium]